MLLRLVPELREMIFWYCNGDDLKNLTCCSHAYKDALEECLWHTVRIPFKQLKDDNFSDDKIIEDLKYTKVLCIGSEFGSMCNLMRGSVKFRTSIQHCNPRVIHTSFVPNDGFNAFGKFDNLVDLYVTSFATNDYTLNTICDNLKELKLLSITGSIVSDEGLTSLDTLNKLERLDISHCYRITDIGLSHIAAIVSLKELDMSGCYGITSTGFSHLRSLIKLQKLDISNCHQVTNMELSFITTIVTLKELNISKCYGISDIGLKYLDSLINLEELDVSSCNQITDMGLLHVATVKNIKRT